MLSVAKDPQLLRLAARGGSFVVPPQDDTHLRRDHNLRDAELSRPVTVEDSTRREKSSTVNL